jgi:hypothetical protein
LAHVHNTHSQSTLPESGQKIAYKKWALSEAAMLFLRNSLAGQRSLAR